jgi:hypothetical protein
MTIQTTIEKSYKKKRIYQKTKDKKNAQKRE